MAMSRQLQLAKREDFFSDPFFQEIWSTEDGDLQKRLEAFKKSSALAVSRGSEAAHNLQVSCSNDKFMVQLELPGFAPEDFSLKAKDDVIVLEAVHEAKDAEGEATSRKYAKEFKVPDGVLKDQLASTYSSEGILTITAPRVLNVPEGAEVKEAMAAASRAYTTDDGKTSVKQDSQSASQMIATSTKSDDGSFSSSTSFSSSSMSSSSSTTTSSTLGGGATPSLEMDDMMKKMMSGMKMGGGDMNLDSMMGSSKFSSSSSTMMSSSSSSMTSSSMTSKMMGGAGKPSLMGNMGNLDIEELSTAGTEFSGPPAYTVTSPRASVDNTGSGFQYRVQPTSDFKPRTANDVDCSVLLKLKKGDEYKLVLNMQAYKPENITVKLNGNDLTVTATSDGGNFKQNHVVPDGIDLDQMTSSFSSDGILVVKAPRKK